MKFGEYAMKSVPFLKYTSFGNNFVLIDETGPFSLDEREKPRFAFYATNLWFGVGADNFLVIQPYHPSTLERIQAEFGYWRELPMVPHVKYVFRMFEPHGAEAYSCGNGLLCVAQYLSQRYGIRNTRILTEVPSENPKVVAIGVDEHARSAWVNLGFPRPIPEPLVRRNGSEIRGEDLEVLEEIRVDRIRSSDRARFSIGNEGLCFKGHLIFTGEPHLVIFVNEETFNEQHAKILFPDGQDANDRLHEKRRNSSADFVHLIGTYIQREYSQTFPQGISVNFVRVLNKGDILEYRCFERGINRETLACGTGAVASAFVGARLTKSLPKKVQVWPHRCRWYQQDARLCVEDTQEGWVLHGNPTLLFTGQYRLDGSRNHLAPWPEDLDGLMMQTPGEAQGFLSLQ